MPFFDFDIASSTSDTGTSSALSLPFADLGTGTGFTLSSGANAGFNLVGVNNSGDGFLSLAASTAGATFLLDVANASSFFAQTGGNITLDNQAFGSGSFNVTFIGHGGTADVMFTGISGGSDAPISFATSGVFSGIRFTQANAGQSLITIDSLSASLVCYLEGTGLATPTGRVQVEDLRAGDVLQTADGGTTTVHWVGHQNVDTRLSQPRNVNPVCITKGAIAANVPERDLFVSPDHAVEIDGYLINASALVNGQTIWQKAAMPLDGFTYYHIETDAHELLLAEGIAAESYVDYVGRDRFDNGAERADAPVIPEMALPRISARRMVPPQIIAQLNARATALQGLSRTAVRAA